MQYKSQTFVEVFRCVYYSFRYGKGNSKTVLGKCPVHSQGQNIQVILSLANRKSGANPSLPRLDTAYQIASALGVSVEFLLTGKERISNPRLDAILNTLMADPDKLDAVEVLLFGKKAGASSKFS